ncbi:SDR family oxidoreductase [Saccharopolyspora erythraea]|uniref:SDR family NAD(P)-dependent oxidoreductase n=1 Tax=Saccharopolyspora erythraea TaxID=1836 RepID=UPI001BAC85DF|nr:SDR family NAD(P)-dependent oxidoreductase [Saccharopolyspora erythraea]QUH00042.1 SDR family oxidoreductase [Saccharopolyspora erythraea]
MDTTDVTALVTGGASGLGLATARALASAKVDVVSVDLPHAVEAAEDFSGIRHFAADVTDAEAVRAAVEAATDPGSPLRIVVNCAAVGAAGGVLTDDGLPHDWNEFLRVITVNLAGTFNVMRLASAAMARTEPLDNGTRGVVINTASITALEGQAGQIAYSASKGGIVGMTLPAARDLAEHGIRVLTISPGVMDTPMIGLADGDLRRMLADMVPLPRRIGVPEDFAKLVLAIVDQDYLNGDVIRLDGALRLS